MLRRDFLAASAAAASIHAAPNPKEWQVYGGDAGAARYSASSLINKKNVSRLKQAWIHHTEDASERPATVIECTPIVVDGTMYLTTAKVKTRAVDPVTGRTKWTFDPLRGQQSRSAPGISRGVTYWQQGRDKRIFSVFRDQVYSIDAVTGELDEKFADKGVLDLKLELDHDMTGLSFRHTTPVVVFEDLVITGGGGGEGPYPEAPGHIRAWDARTGKRRWIFHTVPKPGEFGHDSWSGDSWKSTGGTNCWAGMSVDAKRGIVFAGIGSPSFDFYGGNRKGANLFGNCVLALECRTGKRVWHFQTVHHDVWDYDLPAQPALLTIRQKGKAVDAVVQVTKQGFVFFLDRATGKPLFPVEERPIPKSDVEGEELWPTQPVPLKPPPVSRQGFREDEITNISPEAHAHVRKIWEAARTGDLFTPVAKRGVLIRPGFRGGPLWGGLAYDPERNRIFVGSDEWTNRIILRDGTPEEGFRYGLVDRAPVTDHEGYPAVKPPWGYMTAIDCDSGDFKWRVVNGEFEELKKRGIPKTGTPSHGGAICTAGGLVFKAGTFDRKFRAFDSDTGDVLWEHQLDSGGFATPCSFEAGGKQYVVVAAAGGKDGSKATDEFVAFSLA
ncbi:MAG: pyrroloquinoline quinone-dependent dehydrogenase [Acidobacteria bacterium]|nr:pyrroloquinoline quinone-dependent dehydrogenase [Acidobacteriota bacterium]